MRGGLGDGWGIVLASLGALYAYRLFGWWWWFEEGKYSVGLKSFLFYEKSIFRSAVREEEEVDWEEESVMYFAHPKEYIRIETKKKWQKSSDLPFPKESISDNIDYCPEDLDFNRYLKRRLDNWNLNKSYLEDHGYWQRAVNDKLGAYLFAHANRVRIPHIYYCTDAGPDKLLDNHDPHLDFLPKNTGFVVKNIKGFSAKGVYVLEHGYGGYERLTQQNNMTRHDVVHNLKQLNIQNIYIEELIHGKAKGRVPFDYKFFMFHGEVAAISVVAYRGTRRFCISWMNEHWQRLDQRGCFRSSFYYDNHPPVRTTQSSSSSNNKNSTQQCYPYVPIPNHFSPKPICHDFQPPKNLPKMIRIAKKLSQNLGIFFRIDFLESADGDIVLGEFTPHHTGGKFHCASNDLGPCIDSCMLGRFWKKGNDLGNTIEGGPNPPQPPYFNGWWDKTIAQKCDIIRSINNGQFDFMSGTVINVGD